MTIRTTYKSEKSRYDMEIPDNVWFIPYAVKILKLSNVANHMYTTYDLYANMTDYGYRFKRIPIDYFSDSVYKLICNTIKANRELENILRASHVD